MRGVLAIVVIILGLARPEAAAAQARTMVLVADDRLAASGLLAYLVPRFALKTGIRVEVRALDAADLADGGPVAGADAMIAATAQASALHESGAASLVRAVFHTEDAAEGGAFSVALLADAAEPDHAARFVDWLTSEIGQRAVVAFASETGIAYRPGAIEIAAPQAVLPEGDVDEGEKLAHFHCGRCHVVSERNRFGGIGSTPSFAALRAIPDWEGKFLNFWSANPHPSFTQVVGLTEAFDPDRPPHIAPIEISDADLAAIVAFAASIEPKNLGADVQSR